MFSARKFNRYNVSPLGLLKGQVEGAASHRLWLSSLGQGGCGLYSFEVSSTLVPPQEVACRLMFPDGQIRRVSGELIYVSPIPVGNLFIVNYGVRFSLEHQEILEPLLMRLEKLAAKGELDRA